MGPPVWIQSKGALMQKKKKEEEMKRETLTQDLHCDRQLLFPEVACIFYSISWKAYFSTAQLAPLDTIAGTTGSVNTFPEG